MKLNLAATPGLAFRADPFAASSTMSTTIRTVNPMSDLSIGARPIAVSPNGSISPAIKLQPANPFFDNIRQNLELSHGGITERIPLALGPEVVHRAAELPSFLSDLVRMSDKECSDRLADQFFRIELGEQKRLQAVMDFHSKGSGATWAEKAGHDPEAHCRHSWLEERAADVAEVERLAAWGAGTNAVRDNDFPFSITAGVERGSKNRYVLRLLPHERVMSHQVLRYKNIWPYDFSRVRLTSLCDDESDYINASFVYPRGTARRYIATQGPLDATYRDFWTVVWEQDVRVIAM